MLEEEKSICLSSQILSMLDFLWWPNNQNYEAKTPWTQSKIRAGADGLRKHFRDNGMAWKMFCSILNVIGSD